MWKYPQSISIHSNSVGGKSFLPQFPFGLLTADWRVRPPVLCLYIEKWTIRHLRTPSSSTCDEYHLWLQACLMCQLIMKSHPRSVCHNIISTWLRVNDKLMIERWPKMCEDTTIVHEHDQKTLVCGTKNNWELRKRKKYWSQVLRGFNLPCVISSIWMCGTGYLCQKKRFHQFVISVRTWNWSCKKIYKKWIFNVMQTVKPHLKVHQVIYTTCTPVQMKWNEYI